MYSFSTFVTLNEVMGLNVEYEILCKLRMTTPVNDIMGRIAKSNTIRHANTSGELKQPWRNENAGR